MSTLNSHDNATELDLLRAHVSAFVLHGALPSVDLVIRTGVDVTLLITYVGELKSHMDYLRGYKPLDSWFTQTFRVPNRTWLEEAGMEEQYPYCIKLLDAVMQNEDETCWLPLYPQEKGRYPGEDKRYAQLRVWLTRKGEWIVWANHPKSTFKIVTDAKSALATIEELTPLGITLCDPRGTLRSSALCMFTELRDFLRASIELKRQAAQKDAEVLEVTDAWQSRFQH